MDPKVGMSQKGRKAVADKLAVMLANAYATYLKTQNFHWNVIGSDFFALHLMFEKQYTELSQEVDEIAERIRALGFSVDASFSGFSKLTDVAQEKSVRNPKEMLKSLVKAHETVICQAREITPVAEKENDQGTLDMLGRLLGAHEKTSWMLRSHLS